MLDDERRLSAVFTEGIRPLENEGDTPVVCRSVSRRLWLNGSVGRQVVGVTADDPTATDLGTTHQRIALNTNSSTDLARKREVYAADEVKTGPREHPRAAQQIATHEAALPPPPPHSGRPSAAGR
jgi:hypothetical protein